VEPNHWQKAIRKRVTFPTQLAQIPGRTSGLGGMSGCGRNKETQATVFFFHQSTPAFQARWRSFELSALPVGMSGGGGACAFTARRGVERSNRKHSLSTHSDPNTLPLHFIYRWMRICLLRRELLNESSSCSSISIKLTEDELVTQQPLQLHNKRAATCSVVHVH